MKNISEQIFQSIRRRDDIFTKLTIAIILFAIGDSYYQFFKLPDFSEFTLWTDTISIVIASTVVFLGFDMIRTLIKDSPEKEQALVDIYYIGAVAASFCLGGIFDININLLVPIALCSILSSEYVVRPSEFYTKIHVIRNVLIVFTCFVGTIIVLTNEIDWFVVPITIAAFLMSISVLIRSWKNCNNIVVMVIHYYSGFRHKMLVSATYKTTDLGVFIKLKRILHNGYDYEIYSEEQALTTSLTVKEINEKQDADELSLEYVVLEPK